MYKTQDCEDCIELDNEWRTAIDVVIARIKAEELIAEKQVTEHQVNDCVTSLAEWSGRLSALYFIRTKLEEILDE